MRRTMEAFKDKLTLAGVEYGCFVLENQAHYTMFALTRKDLVFTPEQKQDFCIKKIKALETIADKLREQFE